MVENTDLEKRVALLEEQLKASRGDGQELTKALATERHERQEALLWQEHRFLAAARNLYQHRDDPSLRWAALGGLTSAFFSRSTGTVMAGGGLIALLLTAGLALHANYLLSLQNERMDVQTVVMDGQRRTQNFQAEFALISSDVSEQVAMLKLEQKRLLGNILRSAGSLKEIALQMRIQPDKISSQQDIALNDELEHLIALLATKSIKDGVDSGGERDIFRIRDITAGLFQRLPTLRPFYQFKETDRFRIRDLAVEIVDAHRAYWSALTEGNVRPRFKTDDRPSEIFYKLKSASLARIAGLSQSVRAYPSLAVNLPRFAEPVSNSRWWTPWALAERVASWNSAPVARLTDQKTSPERGQLLTFLLAQRVWLPDVFESGADFSASDLSWRTISPSEISRATLGGASFRRSTISHVDLKGTLQGADFTCATFAGADLSEADLSGANFTGATFEQSFPNYVSLKSFSVADFSEAYLHGLMIKEMDSRTFYGANHEADFGPFLASQFPGRDDFEKKYKGTKVKWVSDGLWEIHPASTGSRNAIQCSNLKRGQ